MPDAGAPISIIQNNFATGEITPKLYGRTDLAKYHSGCAFLFNWYIDYQGGVTTRPGSQYIGAPDASGRARLIPFKFSSTVGQTYMLVFSNLFVSFIKNPGGASYPNSSNAAFIKSAGIQYKIATPYLEADLPFLHYVQLADVMYITCVGHARRKLSRIADNNWTLAVVSSTATISPPTITAVTISALPAGSTDPEETCYMYAVSAVNESGEESLPSVPFVSNFGINIGATQGTVTIFWGAVATATYYKIYKALPTQGDKIPERSEQLGFIGFAYGTVFTDSNIVADFARAPIQDYSPFNPGGLKNYTISASSSDWPVNGTSITVTGGSGSGAVVYPILNNNTSGGVGAITGLYIAHPGTGYTSAPTLAAVGAGGTTFTATAIIGTSTGVEPEVVGLNQQRLIYASTPNEPYAIIGSRPGFPDDFRVTNPVIDSDSFQFNLFSRQVLDIKWLQDMPGGLVIGTNGSIVQLTGGSANANNPVAVTPLNAVVVPQSNYGTVDIDPQVIDYDILFITPEGLIIDLQYNFFVNIYTGTDVTIMSSHFFDKTTITAWAYQSAPRKIVWAVRDDGVLLSLTWLKAQEISGWAHHETQGYYEDVASVQEENEVAVYFSVNRGSATRRIERMSGSLWEQVSDAWQLDSALSTQPTFPAATLQSTGTTGTNVIFVASAAVFSAGDVGKVIFSGGASALVTAFDSTTQIRATITNAFRTAIDGSPALLPVNTWSINPFVSTLGGLTHLVGRIVFALVDGIVQGPFTVSGGGSITLTSPGVRVVVGLSYPCRLQPLYLDVTGETTLQGRRKKVTAASIRVINASRLKYGTAFSSLKEWVQGVSSTDPSLDLPYSAAGLFQGDQRIAVDQVFTTGGWICVEQSYPLPATILSIIPEFAQGDTR